MTPESRLASVNLRVIAALAEKLALDVEAGRLWEGEFSSAMAQIQKAVRDVPNIR
jgi:hypothetical protein